MKKVKSGENFNVSAATWNGFIDAAQYVQDVRQNVGFESEKSIISANEILVLNIGLSEILPFWPVFLTNPAITPSDNENYFLFRKPLYNGKPTCTDGELEKLNIGVALQKIMPGKIGKVRISGVVPAMADISDTEDRYLIINTNGHLASSAMGKIRLLNRPANTGSQFVHVLLGASGESEPQSEYNGMFKLMDSGSGVINVVNGADLTSQYCGYTDIGNAPNMSIAKSNNKNIYLIATYNSTEEKYVFNVKTSYLTGEMYWLLGSIDNLGNLTQIWTQGAIYFAWRFLI